MDFAFIVKRAQGILFTPKIEWPIIEAENAGHSRVLLAWLLPMSLIPAIAGVIGYGLIGFSAGGMHFASISWGLRQGLSQLVGILGGAYVTAFIINALAEKFASRKNIDKAFALVAYAYAPACLGGVLQIIPSMAFIGSLIGLYSLYLLYVGLSPLMQTPPEKNTSFFAASIICAIVVFLVFSGVLAVIFMPGIMS